MIAIVKDFAEIPKVLLNDTRLKAFEQNRLAGRFCANNDTYKPKDLKVALEKIYYKKCVYCEKSLLDAFSHIEHYRPKSIYFWLAYSWDNLLLCCERCNIAKSNKFEIEGQKAVYQNETLEVVHSKIKDYDLIEKPLIINPEQETAASLSKHFTFDLKTGKLKPLSKRMEKTIEICDLNRKDLVDARMNLLTNLKDCISRRKLSAKSKGEFAKLALNVISDFKATTKPSEPYFAWRNFIISNWKSIL